MDPRSPPRCCGKQRPKTGGDYPLPQFSHRWPRWRMKNTFRNQPRLLVAINATGRKRLCKGCATCQSTNPRTNQPKPPLYPITTEPRALPFETIALDFITKLPDSEGNDTILTITDQACSKATFFIPCKETIDAEGVASLYAQKVFPHYGVPKRVISDRDTRFTAKF